MNIKRREVPFIFSWIVYCNIREEALCSYEGPVFIDSGTYCRFTQKWILGALRCEKHLLMFHSPQCKAGIFLIYSPMSGVTWCSEQWRKCCLSSPSLGKPRISGTLEQCVPCRALGSSVASKLFLISRRYNSGV